MSHSTTPTAEAQTLAASVASLAASGVTASALVLLRALDDALAMALVSPPRHDAR